MKNSSGKIGSLTLIIMLMVIIKVFWFWDARLFLYLFASKFSLQQCMSIIMISLRLKCKQGLETTRQGDNKWKPNDNVCKIPVWVGEWKWIKKAFSVPPVISVWSFGENYCDSFTFFFGCVHVTYKFVCLKSCRFGTILDISLSNIYENQEGNECQLQSCLLLATTIC